MVTLVHACPHPDCLTERVRFDMRNVSWAPGKEPQTIRNFIHATCGACALPVAFEVSDESGRGRLGPDVGGYPMSLDQIGWHVVSVWPKPPEPKAPDFLPDAVARAFLAAERTFAMPNKGLEEASAVSYGRALDIGTKLYAPDLADDFLHPRVKKLAQQNRITKDLADWADQIRFIRNSAAHDIDAISRHELIAVRGFTEMVLTYLFTLPGMLAARREEGQS